MLTVPRAHEGALSRRAPMVRAEGCKAAAPVAPATPGKNDRDEDGLVVRRARKPACSVERGCRACRLRTAQSAWRPRPAPLACPSPSAEARRAIRPARRAALGIAKPKSMRAVSADGCGQAVLRGRLEFERDQRLTRRASSFSMPATSTTFGSKLGPRHATISAWRSWLGSAIASRYSA